MSEHFRNIHNYSKLAPAKQTIYQQPNSLTETHSGDEDQADSTDNDAHSTDENGIQQNTTCTLHSQNQMANNRAVEFTRRCEKASVQDRKNFLSTSSTLVNVQTPHLQRQQTQYALNTDSVRNRTNQQHLTAYTSYSNAFNGDNRPVIGLETKRNSGAIDSRRAFMEKLRVNNTPIKDWFQARLLENRMKTIYNYCPSGLIERIKLEKERLRSGLAHIETLMRNPNEHGYVILDDRAISVLVTIIDRILPKDINLELMLSPQNFDY